MRNTFRRQNKGIGNTQPITDSEEDKDISGIYFLKQLTYSIHMKNSEKILKVSYNFKSPKGWVWTSLYLCFDKDGYPRQKAIEWFSKRGVFIELDQEDPLIQELMEDESINTVEVYEWIQENGLIQPEKIRVEMNAAGYPVVAQEIWGN